MLRVRGEVGDTGGQSRFFVAAAVEGLTTRQFVVGFDLGTLTEPTMIAACDGEVVGGGEPCSTGGGCARTRAPACRSI
jgi:hypothetical protein